MRDLTHEGLNRAEYKYYAFISYSRRDSRAASFFHRKIEHFRIPTKYVAPERLPRNRKFVKPVFRDRRDLETRQNSFSEDIKRALESSRYLLVICSPNSAGSEWVEAEISHFLKTHGNDLSLAVPVILTGLPGSGSSDSECLPPSLRNEAVLYRNLPSMIPDAGEQEKDGWENGVIQTLSYLLQVSRERIRASVDAERVRQTRIYVAIGIVSVFVFCALSFWAFRAESKAKANESRAVAGEMMAENNRRLAVSTHGLLEKSMNEAFTRMILKSRRSIEDEESIIKREENLLFVSNLLHECNLHHEFVRVGDGTPLLLDWINGCEGAYEEIPCHLVVDDKNIYGGALFPGACTGYNENIVEFVSLANRIVKGGRFEYDAVSGFVMYVNTMPMSAIRSKGKTALGMVYGFPVMEVDLYSEAYKAVLDGEKAPEEAMKIVSEKIKKIEADDSERVEVSPSKVAGGAIRKYFEDKGHPAYPREDGKRIIFVGKLTNCQEGGFREEDYEFRISVDDEWVCSHVRFPTLVTNNQSEVRAMAFEVNARIENSSRTLVYDEIDGSIMFRSQIHVEEFLNNVENSMIMLLRHPVEVLDDCAFKIKKIKQGTWRGR